MPRQTLPLSDALARLRLDPSASPEEPQFEISLEEAFEGVARQVEVEGVAVTVRLPAGLRPGEQVMLPNPTGRGRLKPHRVRVAAESGREVVGDDLMITEPVDPRLLEDGGRLEVDTPYGQRSVWAPRGLPADAMLRIRDCGLPARDGRPQGHAFVRLKADPARANRIAHELLDRFATAWTPEAPLRKAS